MFAFLLIVQSLIGLALITVILMQRSEGGGLGVGGSSSGFMTARGAADFLTRSTSILGALFIGLSIVMAAIAGASREPAEIDTSLSNLAAPTTPSNSVVPAAPTTDQAEPAPTQNEASNQSMPLVPLAQ
jgi:preprotein translocase subunit SecG